MKGHIHLLQNNPFHSEIRCTYIVNPLINLVEYNGLENETDGEKVKGHIHLLKKNPFHSEIRCTYDIILSIP
ncbi:MAG: hypothetical protein KAI83_12050 [Thiomargarita sp.]|nr:hypothetical protein [Thiomargarita sp.]